MTAACEQALAEAIAPALAILPPRMDSLAARAMLLAIGLQESRLIYRRQIKGPARGLWQFERAGIAGVLGHAATKAHARALCEARGVKPTVAAVYAALEHDDVLAAGFARLLLWTLPAALPGPDAPAEGWRQYIDAWRPGKPHPTSWKGFYIRAWDVLQGASTA